MKPEINDSIDLKDFQAFRRIDCLYSETNKYVSDSMNGGGGFSATWNFILFLVNVYTSYWKPNYSVKEREIGLQPINIKGLRFLTVLFSFNIMKLNVGKFIILVKFDLDLRSSVECI